MGTRWKSATAPATVSGEPRRREATGDHLREGRALHGYDPRSQETDPDRRHPSTGRGAPEERPPVFSVVPQRWRTF
jgi:hypothetical protein